MRWIHSPAVLLMGGGLRRPTPQTLNPGPGGQKRAQKQAADGTWCPTPQALNLEVMPQPPKVDVESQQPPRTLNPTSETATVDEEPPTTPSELFTPVSRTMIYPATCMSLMYSAG